MKIARLLKYVWPFLNITYKSVKETWTKEISDRFI